MFRLMQYSGLFYFEVKLYNSIIFYYSLGIFVLFRSIIFLYFAVKYYNNIFLFSFSYLFILAVILAVV